jgi:hypothetical protein
MRRIFHPILIWAAVGTCIGAGIAVASTLLYMWIVDPGSSVLVQHNTSLGALIGLHLSLLIAYVRSYLDEAPAAWEVTQREPTGIILAGMLLIYAICWIAITL